MASSPPITARLNGGPYSGLVVLFDAGTDVFPMRPAGDYAASGTGVDGLQRFDWVACCYSVSNPLDLRSKAK